MPSIVAYPTITFIDYCNSIPYDSTKWFWNTENANTEITADGSGYQLKGTTYIFYKQSIGSKSYYTSNYFDINFSIKVSLTGSGNYFFGIVNKNDINDTNYDNISDGICWKMHAYNNYVGITITSDGTSTDKGGDEGDLPTTETTYRLQYNGTYLIASINGVIKYQGAVSVNFDATVGIWIEAEANDARYLNIYDVSASFNALIEEVNTTISIFTPVSIDNATINLVSKIFTIFIDAAKCALVVGQIVYENIIDITTTVIKIGQSTLTIIAQASAYIYSGLITIIDKVIVAINSFNVLIDSIITTFKTIYDADTVYGSVIKVIPLILVLSIPTIVVYYKIGEFATIPMFMFMSIVAYITSLMPLWILVVALIGCITILIQKQRRSN
jgi:hypothetical protein